MPAIDILIILFVREIADGTLYTTSPRHGGITGIKVDYIIIKMNLLERTKILEPNCNGIKTMEELYDTSFLDDRMAITQKEITYQRIGVEILEKYVERLEHLEDRYDLINKLSEGKTTFFNEYVPYKRTLKIYGIIGQALYRKKEKIDQFKREYLEPINKCAYIFDDEELSLEDVDTFIESRYVELAMTGACGLYAVYNLAQSNTETALSSTEAGLMLGGIIEGVLFLIGGGDIKLVKKIKNIDKKMKAV